jgi:hypothetical protein
VFQGKRSRPRSHLTGLAAAFPGRERMRIGRASRRVRQDPEKGSEREEAGYSAFGFAPAVAELNERRQIVMFCEYVVVAADNGVGTTMPRHC